MSPILPIPAPGPRGNSAAPGDRASRTVRDAASRAGNNAEGDGGTPGAWPRTGDSGAISAGGEKLPPDALMLRRILAALEAAWLADLSTAPHDDQAVALVQGMTLTGATLAAVLADRDPRFLRALLLRGASRLWADGPTSNPQKP